MAPLKLVVVIRAGTRRAAATIAGCICVAFYEGFDLQAAGFAAGGVAAEFPCSPDQLGTFFSASSLGLLAGALAEGRLSDWFGRKRVLIGSVALFGLLSALTAAAHDIQTLCWTCLLTGAGLGGVFPNLLALVNESSSVRPPQRQTSHSPTVACPSAAPLRAWSAW